MVGKPAAFASLLAAVSVALLAGCTSFGGISWRNALIVLRSPDRVLKRITEPRRPDARLAALWVGHSTVLVQMDDKYVLTDPVFTGYVGGVSARLVEPGIAVENLPSLSVVLVSHRHFDHLSKGSLAGISQTTETVMTPLGAGGDIPSGNYEILELASWQSVERDGMRVTSVPARHSGGRLPWDESAHPMAFTGFVVEYRGLTVYFAGDSAYDETMFHSINARFATIDLAILPIGPIKPVVDMLPHHMNPEQALRATSILHAAHVLPIHFATFINSFDKPGSVELAYVKARADLKLSDTQDAPWRIGEQRVLIAR